MTSRCLYDERGKYNVRLPKFQIQQDLKHCNNIEKFPKMMSLDDELTELCHRQSLSDLDLRVRFLICAMMEDLLQVGIVEALLFYLFN